ncbi:MAG: RluA family pseudouridine synthase [Rickettsiales bacterium]|jgi:23S rRNA pseudouridine955/2504/2580 synthase|nr:RluA family pseudouridine synthase [Rickettsiales bacterium]
MAELIEISKTDDGTRLLRWFLRAFPGLPQKDFYRLCRGGQIRVNSSRCRGTEILRSGDHVRIPPTTEYYSHEKIKKTESGDRYSLADLEWLRRCIVHDDADIVVFDKPAGLAVQGGTGIRRSVDKMAAALFPYDKISLVHRLDKETSGILVVAKNHNAAQALSREFQNKTARKEYLALLMGNVSPTSGIIDNFMVKGRIMDAGDKNPTGPRPQHAVTEYRVLSQVSDVLSWVLFMPKTGRTHQLRTHSAFSLDAPIVGDTLYGGAQKLDGTLDSILATKNLFLFAHRLTFRHPGTGKIMTVRAEIPEFMAPIVKFLEFKVPE